MKRVRNGRAPLQAARRRPLSPRIGAALFVAIAAIAAVVWWWRGDERTRSVVLISIDTLRADHLPIYGYTKVATPALDALAAESVVFTRAYAHSPQTLPSHTSILTGLLPFEHGVRDNVGFTLKSNPRMLQHYLRERGYATAAMVSSFVLRAETGLAQGFDTYDAQMPPASPELSVGQVQRDGAATIAAAEKWLDGRTDGPPFFLFVHLYEPHTPYSPPARYGRYDPYDGEIAYSDELVGRLKEALRSRGLYDDATVVLLSDHGEGLGDHGELEHGVFLYDESVRVPLMIKLPRGRNAGRRVDAPVQHIDVLPTLLAVAGVAPVGPLQGRSLVGAMAGEPLAETGVYGEALYARYHFCWSELYSLTDSRYRYIRAPRDELYDLSRDPDERQNLAAARAETRVAMRGEVERLLGNRGVDAPSRVSDEDRERLQALGYIGMQASLSVATPSDALADPKDKVKTLERYRRAVTLAGSRKFDEAIALLREILLENPGMADVWNQLGNLYVRSDRMNEAVEAYRQFVALRPSEASGLIAVGSALLRVHRVDEARRHALAATELADVDARSKATAFELLAKIALRERDRAGAERYARAAQEADPTLPMPAFVQGRLHYDEGRYNDALPFFLEAVRQLEGRTVQMTDLHFFTGDTLARLERYPEAERHFREEIRLFPQSIRARAGLAMLYRAQGRLPDSDKVIKEMLRVSPTREGYDMAAQLWTTFGEPEKAAAARAEFNRAAH